MSKNVQNRHKTKTAHWGTTLRGVDEGDGWLNMGDGLYLPFELAGHRVLQRLEAEEELADPIWHGGAENSTARGGGVGPSDDVWSYEALSDQGPPEKVAKAPAPPPKDKAPAFAVLPSKLGPMLAAPDQVPALLLADWALFLELVAYALHGHMKGCVAFGMEEVAEACMQEVVSVLFVTVSCGSGGEVAVRKVATAGGRGYIVGMTHELHDDLYQWGCAAILFQPLKDLRITAEEALEKQRKIREAKEAALGVATAKAAPAEAPPGLAADKNAKAAPDAAEAAAAEEPGEPEVPMEVPQTGDPEKDLRYMLKGLGKVQNLNNARAIPSFAEAMRERFLPSLGASAVFSTFGKAFAAARLVAQRKAMVYVAHELMMRCRKEKSFEEWRPSCLKLFLLDIGELVRGFKADERQSYCRVATEWKRRKCLPATEFEELKDSWDLD